MSWLSNIIPTISSLFGSPLGSAAAEVVGDALGLSDKTESAIKKVLDSGTITPEGMAALQKADQEFKQKLTELGIEAEKIANLDRSGAREMYSKSMKSWVPDVFGFMLIATFLFIVCSLLCGYMKLWENQTLTMLLGQLTGCVAAVVGFYFGASHQSPPSPPSSGN